MTIASSLAGAISNLTAVTSRVKIRGIGDGSVLFKKAFDQFMIHLQTFKTVFAHQISRFGPRVDFFRPMRISISDYVLFIELFTDRTRN
jgi:hypothetical protein